MSKHKRNTQLATTSPLPLPPVVVVEETKPQDSRCCGDCQHYKELTGEHGQCRRYPPHIPSLALTSNGPFGIFPITLSTELCGEHRLAATNSAK